MSMLFTRLAIEKRNILAYQTCITIIYLNNTNLLRYLTPGIVKPTVNHFLIKSINQTENPSTLTKLGPANKLLRHGKKPIYPEKHRLHPFRLTLHKIAT